MVALCVQSQPCRLLRSHWRINTFTMQHLVDDDESSPSSVGLDGLLTDVASQMGGRITSMFFGICMQAPPHYLPSLILLLGRFDSYFNADEERSTRPLLAALRRLSELPTEETHGVSVMDLIVRTVYCLCNESGVREHTTHYSFMPEVAIFVDHSPHAHTVDTSALPKGGHGYSNQPV